MPLKVLPPFLAATGRTLAVPAAPATTWDPAHHTNSTLSNGNLTALHSGGGASDMNAFSIATNTTNQKVYFEATLVAAIGFGFLGIGQDNTSTIRLDTSTVSPTKGATIAGNGTYFCFDSADHFTAFLSSFTTGDRIDIAFDSGANLIWFRKNGGAWNDAHAGTQDPATGQGGAAVTNTPATGPWYAFCGVDAVDGDGWTARFASGSWLNAAPSGFSQIAA